MTTKQRLKKLHRARRVIKRETAKAFSDALLFGTGTVLQQDAMDARRIRLADFLVNPPYIYDEAFGMTV